MHPRRLLSLTPALTVKLAVASTSLPQLTSGVTAVDIIGDGSPAIVLLSHRENFNAHSFNLLTLYWIDRPSDGTAPIWQVIPIVSADGSPEQDSALRSGGADCVLQDFRIVNGNHGPAQLILAKRDFGNSFIDPGPVTFHFYELRDNKQGIPGFPKYYYEESRALRTKRSYCDVGDAFQKELNIGTYGAER